MALSRFLLAAFVLLALAACTTSHTLVGQPRPPIDPAQVRVYFQAPTEYEEIALLESSSQAFGAQNRNDAAIDKLRREAASLGANGVLFRGAGDAPGNTGVGLSGFSFGGRGGVGLGISGSPSRRYAHGVAIWVPPHAQVRYDQQPPAEPAPAR
ncbi:hypothetical protein [Coralloluteibacterium thermophilus]|uniref:DUF4156 domain-containing protein n=1 Tax=Coralloluteibacterium thermophilum TaxID=2707049 RepID=A0ABV9NKL8_9GAMM